LAGVLAVALQLLPARSQPEVIAGLSLIVCLLLHPVFHLPWLKNADSAIKKLCRSAVALVLMLSIVLLFGIYVWPPIRRHTLSEQEENEFIRVLKEEKGGDQNIEVQIVCPSGDEKTCVYAAQFVPMFGQAGWQIRPEVTRVALARASDGITVLRRAGVKAIMEQHWDSGGYVAVNEAHLVAVQKAFQGIHIEIESGADPDLSENTMAIYIGLERENEAEPTNLTRTAKWLAGDRKGPFPVPKP
jgi:hypothetical protein